MSQIEKNCIVCIDKEKTCKPCKENELKFCKGCSKTKDVANSFSVNASKCKPCRSEEARLRTQTKLANLTITGTTTKPREKAIITKNGKICIGRCAKDLPLSSFPSGRNKCKDCRKQDNLDLSKKREEEGVDLHENLEKTRRCNNREYCKTEGLQPIENFEKTGTNYRKECKICREKERPVVLKEEIVEKVKGTFITCIDECGLRKEATLENFAINGNGFRNQCRMCINKKGYYKVYRNKKMMEDALGFRNHNTEIHRLWIERNPERNSLNQKTYNRSEAGIARTYMASGTSKGLITEDREETREMFTKLIRQPCFYCGVQHEDRLGGVDRIVSSIEYTFDNCVPCCSFCNMMKNTLDVASFLRKVREIAIFNKDYLELDLDFCTPLEYHQDIELIGGSMGFVNYEYRAKKKGKIFEMTLEMFKEIVSSNCYICGISHSDGKFIGVDRKDSSLGYISGNIFPCCSYCNYMKREWDYEQFLDLVKNITVYSNDEIHKKYALESIMCRARTKR